jgi:alkylated DNA repair protein alkB homolog 7
MLGRILKLEFPGNLASSMLLYWFCFVRRRYEQGHWDSVIQKYREIELLDDESEHLKPFLQPIRELLETNHSRPKSYLDGDASLYFSGSWLRCHAIDLHPSGSLNAHVDSVRYSGNVVAGLSLLSESIMRLKPSGEAASGYIDLLLPTRSLYVLSGVSRYSYTHELLSSGSVFLGTTPVHRDRRFSIIFRDAKDHTNAKE